MRINFAARLQLVLSVDDDNVAGNNSTGDRGHIVLGEGNRDLANFDCLVRLDHKHIAALRPVLHRDRRNHGAALVGFQKQSNIDELVGPKQVVLIIEHRFKAAGAGGLVDLIVDGQQFAGGDLV